eukprot:scaffold37417_cov31-Tisochrysis_lutea.AAC.1
MGIMVHRGVLGADCFNKPICAKKAVVGTVATTSRDVRPERYGGAFSANLQTQMPAPSSIGIARAGSVKVVLIEANGGLSRS